MVANLVNLTVRQSLANTTVKKNFILPIVSFCHTSHCTMAQAMHVKQGSKRYMSHVLCRNYRLEVRCVEKVLADLEVNKAPGPDGIPLLVLKMCAISMSAP